MLTTPADIEDARNLAELGDFCRRMGRDARQGEVGLVVGNEYVAIRDFAEAITQDTPTTRCVKCKELKW